MNLIKLVEENGATPFKTSSRKGGEYHCPCPKCGGHDRFMFWPEENFYWCRQCHTKGDAIQFCRDFQGLSFHKAAIKVKGTEIQFHQRQKHLPSFQPPSLSWQEKVKAFTNSSHQRLLIDSKALKTVECRGLSIETIKDNYLGWNPVKTFQKRSDWGLDETEKNQLICLPLGIVIPIFVDGSIQKLKFRKLEWKEGDPYGKYYELPGSSNALAIFGNPSKEVTIVIESELDAMLIIQETADLCSCIALGGAQKRPDDKIHQLLQSKKLILFCLDFDDAGKKEYAYWKKHYQNLRLWPTPQEKSPGDYFLKGGNIRDWITLGMNQFLDQKGDLI